MGYDMEWMDIPAAKTEAVEEIWTKIKALGHGHEAIPGLFEEMDAVRDYYFRVNIFGMSTLRRVMVDAGMVDLDYEHTPFDMDRALDEEDIVAEYDEAVGLPPIYKFGSNDGWLVGPEEIEKALGVWDSLEEMRQRELVVLATPDSDEDGLFEWVLGWFNYWRGAKEHGGFRVY